VVGYYQAPERVGDATLSPVGERLACKIKECFETPLALVVSFHELSSFAPLSHHFLRHASPVQQTNGSNLDDENGRVLIVRRPKYLTIPLILLLL